MIKMEEQEYDTDDDYEDDYDSDYDAPDPEDVRHQMLMTMDLAIHREKQEQIKILTNNIKNEMLVLQQPHVGDKAFLIAETKYANLSHEIANHLLSIRNRRRPQRDARWTIRQAESNLKKIKPHYARSLMEEAKQMDKVGYGMLCDLCLKLFENENYVPCARCQYIDVDIDKHGNPCTELSWQKRVKNILLQQKNK